MKTKTKIKIKTSEENILNEEYIEVDLPYGTKILCNEAYVKEALDMYLDKIPENLNYNLNDGEIVEGKITNIYNNNAVVDINGKHTVFVDINKERSDYKKFIKTGLPIKIKLSKKNDEYTGSFTNAIKNDIFMDIYNSIGNQIAYKAKVTNLIHGGYYLNIDGVDVFMPGSLGGLNKLVDFQDLIGKTLIVMPINYSTEKNTIVVSHRAYLHTLIPEAIKNIEENLDKTYNGFITGTTDFGIFIEFNQCLTGLIPSNELNNEYLNKFNNKLIKPGDLIEFKIKNIINDKKIILTQLDNDVWKDLDKKYIPKSNYTGKIIKKKNYGLFIELEKDVIGLLSNDNIDYNNYNINDNIEVIIEKLDIVNHKINLSLK